MLGVPPTRRSARRARSACPPRTRATLTRSGVALPRTTRRPAQHRAPACHPAGVVAWRAIGLVAPVVLLVDDDQADVGQRRERRRSCSDHHARLAAKDPPPAVMALPRRQARVEHGELVADRGAEAVGELRDEAHLGHEHDRRPTGIDRLAHGREVDVGLARCGHPLEQQLPTRTEGGDRIQRLGPARGPASGVDPRGSGGAPAGHARRCASRARLDRAPASRRAGARRELGSVSSASASSASVRSPVPSASSSARCTGARRGGSASPEIALSTRTRRSAISGGRSDQSARIAPARRSRSTQADRPRFGAVSLQRGVGEPAVRRPPAPRPRGGRSSGRRTSQRRTRRDSSPGGSMAASVVPIGAR